MTPSLTDLELRVLEECAGLPDRTLRGPRRYTLLGVNRLIGLGLIEPTWAITPAGRKALEERRNAKIAPPQREAEAGSMAASRRSP